MLSCSPWIRFAVRMINCSERCRALCLKELAAEPSAGNVSRGDTFNYRVLLAGIKSEDCHRESRYILVDQRREAAGSN